MGLAEPTKITLKITVPLTKQPIMHWPRPPPPPPPPPPENEEIVARRWLAKTGRYAAKVNNLEEDWWMRFVLCLKQPCGRVEKQGSQQHLLQMVVPSMALAERLVGRGRHGVCMHLGKKYYVDPETRIASWVKSRRVDTYVIEDAYVLGEYLNLHNRNLGKHLLLYKSSKLGPITKVNGYKACTVLITFLSPLTLEVVRSGRRIVVKAELNSQVINDLQGHTLPPLYEYAAELAPIFWHLSLNHLAGMRKLGFPLSTKFLELINGSEDPVSSESEAEDCSEVFCTVYPPPPSPTPAF